MAKDTKQVEVPFHIKEKQYIVCDKCYGDNHEKTDYPYEDLNQVVLGAEAKLIQPEHPPISKHHVEGEYHYILCDDCYGQVVEHIENFF